jgi:UDP-glucose 4-epimerase
MKNNVLITGVAGMIGSHLLDELLERNYRIIGIDDLSFGKMENIKHNLDNPNFDFHRVNILDFDMLKVLGRDVDIIVHLAAVKKIDESKSSMDTLRVNTLGTEYVLETAKKWRTKVVYASTSDVYGMSPDLPFKESGDLLLGPGMVRRWSYAVAKLYGEQLTSSYHHDYDIPVVVLRYFGGFSPRSSFAWSGGHIPIFVRAILNDEEVMIHGDGKQTRSMAYVDDLVDGTILAMENDDAIGGLFNLGNDEEISVLDSAKIIHRLANTGKALKKRFIPFEEIFGEYKDIMRRVPDLTKAMEILGYSPKFSFEKAIKKTLAHLRK